MPTICWKTYPKTMKMLSTRNSLTLLIISSSVYLFFNQNVPLQNMVLEVVQCLSIEIQVETSTKMYAPLLIGLNLRYGPYAHFGYRTLVNTNVILEIHYYD